MNMLVTILRGAPGSGKSTLCGRYPSAFIVSADHFFQKEGEYQFDRNKLSEAHGECLNRFVRAVMNQHPHIIVDNTNVAAVDVSPYYSVARAFGYDVEVKTFIISPETSFKRNLHSVPMKSCKDMCDRIVRQQLPQYWKIKEERIVVEPYQP